MKDISMEEVVLPVRLMKRMGDRDAVPDQCFREGSTGNFTWETS